MTETEVKILRDYAAGADFASIAKKFRIRIEVVSDIASRLNYQRARAGELLRQHSFGVDVSLPIREVRRAAAPTTSPAPVVAAPARAKAADDPPAVEPWTPGAGIARLKRERADLVPEVTEEAERTADEIVALAETPRRQDPRPAGEALVLPAAVGGDDADEEVAAGDVGASGPAATALDVPALVERALDHAYFFAARWYCPSCIAWPLDPGACQGCGAALQPVYLATLPREISA